MAKLRFAPSPTGKLHIGNVRTAIICWLAARKFGGEFMLRIDDTDRERSKDEYTQAIKEDLTWLGLNWDDLAHQRDREARYAEQIEKLKADGRIYPCYETSEQLELKRKTLLSRGLPPIYDRAALSLTDEQKAKLEAEGKKPHWRFKLNHEPIVWNDLIRGEVRFHGKDTSDPVVLREDGSPLYHLCSVIDDIDFGITHVLRGEDHVSNTATHVQMFEALGGKVPDFAHTPLLADLEGGKLSKRLGALGISTLRDEEGVEPMAILSFLSRLGTSDPIEAFNSPEPLINGFDFGKFSRSSSKVDLDEIYRLNAKILHQMDYADVKDRPEMDGVDENLWNAARPNISRLRDIRDWLQMASETVESTVADEDKDYIKLATECLPEGEFTDNTWSEWINAIKEKSDRKGKALFMPLRQALTGMNHGPELDKLLTLLGRERILRRLNRAYA